jgi:hypothetical protein
MPPNVKVQLPAALLDVEALKAAMGRRLGRAP